MNQPVYCPLFQIHYQLSKLIIVLLLLVSASSQAQTIRYVKPIPSGSGDGSSWVNATSDLQTAINSLSANGGQVWVASGIYKPTTTTGPSSRTISFAMKSKVAVYGGFAGSETSLSNRVVSYPSSTTLSGNIGDQSTDADNSNHVVVSLQTDSTAILDGFVITAGNSVGVVNYYPYTSSNGSGLYSNYSSLRLNNCYFVANSAEGGAVFMQNLISSRLTNCTFQNNLSDGINSECYNNFSFAELALINCSFQSNARRGAVLSSFNSQFSSSVTYKLINCTFHNNNGAGIYASDPGPQRDNYSVQLNLLNCIVYGNVGESAIKVDGIPVIIARYCLLDQTATNYNSDGTNLVATYSPFVSTSSDQLISCSQAIDAGDPATTTGTVGAVDLAGNPRFVRSRIDMGAYEYQAAACNPEISYIYTLQAGRWNDPAIWSVGRLPTSADKVLLKHSVTINQGYEAHAKQLYYDLSGHLSYETSGRLLLNQ